VLRLRNLYDLLAEVATIKELEKGQRHLSISRTKATDEKHGKALTGEER
jgi:hypothetical protein